MRNGILHLKRGSFVDKLLKMKVFLHNYKTFDENVETLPIFKFLFYFILSFFFFDKFVFFDRNPGNMEFRVTYENLSRSLVEE